MEKFISSNSANAMSKSIGLQIDKLIEHQSKLEKDFDNLIIEKTKLTELVDQDRITSLIAKIKGVAKDLKKSTNDICKSLSENPDIPANLNKAKEEKETIKKKLLQIKNDLYAGSLNFFNSLMVELKANTINIEEKRKREMKLLEELKKLNEDLSKEEQEYKKDQNNLNNKLQETKKDFAKTKQESEVLREFRDKDLDALKTLKNGNFDDDETMKERLIIEKSQEKEKEISISSHILTYLASQKARVLQEKDEWEKRKNDKQSTYEKKMLNLDNAITEKQNDGKKLNEEIELLKKKIKMFENDDPECVKFLYEKKKEVVKEIK